MSSSQCNNGRAAQGLKGSLHAFEEQQRLASGGPGLAELSNPFPSFFCFVESYSVLPLVMMAAAAAALTSYKVVGAA